MKNKIRVLVGVMVIIVAIGIYLYPLYREHQIASNASNVANRIKQYRSDERPEDGKEEKRTAETEILPELYGEMQVYNERLISEGQQLLDAWSYVQTPVELSEILEEEAIGSIEIPDMDVELPVYIGASEEHMALGAAVLSETSMPIGGMDTNCVIAGHRGYGGAAYFRDIENLQEGSLVYLMTPWETLVYQAVKTEIIDPWDVESILIQPGKDMLTLLTCHPYMSGGQYRYVVYCERVYKDMGDDWKDTEGSLMENLPNSDQNPGGQDDSTVDLVVVEKMIQILLPLFLLMFAAIRIVRRILRKKGGKRLN